MMEFEFLNAVGAVIPTFQNLPMPVIAVDPGFAVHWSNQMARQRFGHLTEPDGVRRVLAEFDLEQIRASALQTGCCVVGDILPLHGMWVHITPLLHKQDPAGFLLFLAADTGGFAPRVPDFNGGAARILSEGIRRAVGEVFDAMDAAALKADMMAAGWIKPSLVQAEYYGYRVLRTADNVAEYAALQNGGPALQLELVDMAKMLQELSGPLQTLAAGAGVPVTVSLPQAPLYAQLDRDRFDLILFNLLHNALYYTRADNTIRLAAYAEAGGVCIEITDRGLGIPPDAVEKAFQPFFSYMHDGGRPTTGLGLTLAERLTNAHGGKITLASRLGEGTQVELWLPGGGFSAPSALGQGMGEEKLGNRFSRFYTGLGDIAASPYRSEPAKEENWKK